MSQITQNLGKIVPNHRGGYDPDVQYRVMDEVFYFGASYRAVEIPPLGTPPTDEDYWVIVSESSARLTDVEVIDTSVDGEVTIRFTYEDLTSYDVTTGPLTPDLVNPDWEAISGPAQILNKPSLGNAAFASIGLDSGNVAAGDHIHDNATTSVSGFMSAADKTKLNGIATGATNNQSNSYLLDRGNHTNTQAISTVDGLQAALNSKANTASIGIANGIASLDSNGKLPQTQGGGQPIITLDISGGDLTPAAFYTALNHIGFYRLATSTGGPIQFPASWTSVVGVGYGTVEGYTLSSSDYVYCYQILTGSTGNRWIRRATSSTVWGAWTEQVSAGIATTSANGLMSSTDKIKLNGIATAATANQTDAYLLNRANHTGSQAISTVSGLTAALTPVTSYRLGPAGYGITSWDDAIENGWYMGSDATNAPLPSIWFIGNVETHIPSLWVTQTVHSFTDASDTNTVAYRRHRKNGTWTGWYKLQLAQAEQDARYLQLSGGTMGANAVVQFSNEATDKIRYYSNTYGVGIESTTLTHWSASNFRWRTGSTSVSTGTTRMELSTTALSVTGNITATGDVGAYSDGQLKSNVETIESALDKVSNLRGVYYTKDDKRGVGVIAQEVQKVIPEVVGKSGEYLTVSYGNLVGVLIEAIKELKAEVETLKRIK